MPRRRRATSAGPWARTAKTCSRACADTKCPALCPVSEADRWTPLDRPTVYHINQYVIAYISTGTLFANEGCRHTISRRHETRRTQAASLFAHGGAGDAHYGGAGRTDRGHAPSLAASSLVVRRRERGRAHPRDAGVAAE